MELSELDFVFQCRNGTDFRGEDYNGLRVEDLEVEGIDFSHVVFRDCVFIRCKFIRCGFYLAELEQCVFEECDFHGSDLRSLAAEDVNFEDCDLRSVDFGNCIIDNLSMFACFGKVDFSLATLRGAVFMSCEFAGSDFNRADFENSYWQDCDLSGLMVGRGTDLKNATLLHCNLTNTNLKAASNYNEEVIQDCYMYPFCPDALGNFGGFGQINTSPRDEWGEDTKPGLGAAGSSGVNLGIYGVSTVAHLYCSDLDLYRNTR